MTKSLSKLALVAAVAAVPALTGTAQAQRLSPTVVAVVDTQRILAECTACKAANAQLQTQAQQLQQRQQALAAPIQTEGNSLQTAINALNGKQPDAALQKRITDFQTKQSQAQQELGDRENSIRSTQQNVLQQINVKLKPIVDSVMTARGASIVLDRGDALAAASSIDVTNDVLAQLNTQLPSVSVTPLPQQAAAAGARPATPATTQGR